MFVAAVIAMFVALPKPGSVSTKNSALTIFKFTEAPSLKIACLFVKLQLPLSSLTLKLKLWKPLLTLVKSILTISFIRFVVGEKLINEPPPKPGSTSKKYSAPTRLGVVELAPVLKIDWVLVKLQVPFSSCVLIKKL